MINGLPFFLEKKQHQDERRANPTTPVQQRKALKQLPFNGKKTKPTKLRFDYWSQMATIELPKGTAVHTFEKLRELRQLHELCWSPKIVQDEINRRKDEEVELSKKRLLGRALCNQYGNTVADIAAVLGGVGGRSNVLVLGTEHVPKRDKEEWSDKKQPKSAASGGRRPKLLPATVRWANDSDRFYARRWTKNVRHELLPGATILRDEEFRKAHKAAQAEEEAKAELKAKREQLEKKGFKKDEWAPTKYLVKKKATETE